MQPAAPPVLIPLAFPHHAFSERCCLCPCLPWWHRVSPTNTVCPPQPHKAPTDQPSCGMLTHTAEPHTPPRAPGAAQPYLGDSELLGMKAKSRRGKKSLGPIIPKPLVRFGCILQGVGERCGGCQPCRAGSSVHPPPILPPLGWFTSHWERSSSQNCLPTARCSPGEGRRRLPGMVQAQLTEPLPCPRGRGGAFSFPQHPPNSGAPPATDSLAKYTGNMVLWASLAVLP